ncbi:MAG TPA: hypothetical protein VD930_03980 [Gemmatimonadales bacterium]|nr:hypothetical protein [Gemmatimonadales bacterium]
MRRISRVLASGCLAAAVPQAGCGRVEQDLHEKPVRSPSQPSDSLVLEGPKGREVWFTLAREGRAPDGTTCIERGLEIRHGARRVPIPLLYTGVAPVVLNDSTIRAVLWTNCSAGDTYRVNLETGRPVREATGGKDK